jgi:hypothetical protein
LTDTVGVLLVQVVRVPDDGIDDFRRFESAVLPLLPEFGARLERRLRSLDEGVEIHILWFPSHDALQLYLADPRRQESLHLLHRSQAAAELFHVMDVADEQYRSR